MGSSSFTPRGSKLYNIGAAVFLAASVAHGHNYKLESRQQPFSWSSLEASSILNWVPCYENKQCAKLKVPLDYSNEAGESAGIALLRVPAQVSSNDPSYGGPVLVNPGGPGYSGVNMALSKGEAIQTILGTNFDVVGFDPRGVGYTTPPVNVFDNELDRAAWVIRTMDAPLVGQTHNAIGEILARVRLYNDLIAAKAQPIALHTNTAVVARDLLSIVQAHGRDKLYYWGVSYGSVLGNTFATMYPNNVGRIIVDGVLDAQDYYKGNLKINLVDTDEVLDTIYEACAKAGPEKCPLHEASGQEVRERVNALLQSLEARPIGVRTETKLDLITYNTVWRALWACIQDPYAVSSLAFGAMAALEKGDGQIMSQLASASIPQIACDCSTCSTLPEKVGGSPEQSLAVICNDVEKFSDNDDEWYQTYKDAAQDSPFANLYFEILSHCVGWKVEPKWKFYGPLGANTSYPLLMIGNKYDPVTPIRGAHNMVKLFPGSVVLQQDSVGHTSQSGVSACVYQAIRAYIQEGKLPAEGTICPVDNEIFTPPAPPSP